MPPDPAAFVRAHTVLAAPPLVPEIRLHLATEVTPLWQATEATLAATGLPPPYWAFAWAGGQGLARHVLDHPLLVRGRRVIDVGAGSGLGAIAAARAGAQHVTALEIDPFAVAAIALNAAANRVAVVTAAADAAAYAEPADVVLVGDMCYERALAARLVTWLAGRAASGALVLLGDPGRAYLPRVGLAECARYTVPTSRELEDRDSREAVVWRLSADASPLPP
ncbi:MAG TPA: 50S ribosomal protein L11 methyltransferase [Stellaceae bacterium]|nr:50S ribosomal protein L11 methyltransferase [Stellaceae bacterium]